MTSHRKLAAILSADVAGYSRLMADDERATLETLNTYRQVIRERVTRHEGRVVDAPGDALLAEFPSAVEAVDCASEIQHEIAKRNAQLAEHRRMLFRIGINLGDVLEEDGAIYGDGVNVAARLQELAETGGICISGTAFDQVEGKLPLSFKFTGEQQVKNIPKPVRAYRVHSVLRAKTAFGKEQSPLPMLDRVSLVIRQRRTVPITFGIILAVVLIALGGTIWHRFVDIAKPDSVQRNRIAVLPLANISADPNDEYFADGMTEELISQLSKIHGLEVIARTSVMAYKGKDKKIDEIGEELRVGIVLEGSVRKSENQIRITAQLIDVASQAHLWAQEYDREMKGVFVIQSDIAKSVAAALKIKLDPYEQRRIAKKSTDDPEAHELYLKGLYQWNKQTKEGIKRSIEYYEQAITKDPSYAEAYAWLGYAHEIQGWYGLASEKEAFARAKELALKALELDSQNAHALSVLANMTVVDWDWPRAESLYQRALSINPNSAMIHDNYGIEYLSALGRNEEALTSSRRAVELDPLSAQYPHDLGWVLQLDQQYDAAIEQFQKSLQMEPSMSNAYRGLGETYAYKGMYEKSIEAMQKLVKTTDGSPYALASLGWAYGVAGKKGEALTILDMLKEKAMVEPVAASDFARVYLGLGDKNQALFWLEKTYEERSGLWILVWAKRFPFFDGLRTEPRFKALLKKIGLEQ